jgi:hypothetical protein
MNILRRLNKKILLHFTRDLSQYYITFLVLTALVLTSRFVLYPDREVVQRERPSNNPKGTCPRWAVCPATPDWAIPRTQTVSKHLKGGGRNTFISGGSRDVALANAV